MKRFLCLILVVLMIASLCACAKKSSNTAKPQNTTPTQTQENNYPKPSKVTFENSPNKLGARYIFTLEEYTTMLNNECKALGNGSDTQFFDYENWEKVSQNLTDDNGVLYESYSYVTDMLTITASVETESKKLMNISCGAPYEMFTHGDEEFQYNVILTTAILSMVAGGYTEQDLEFLYSIFYDSAQKKKGFFYCDSLYMMNLNKDKGEKVSSVLFMTSPCSSEIIDEWGLLNYADFDGTYNKT